MCGLRSEATQKKLLTEADLTFKLALEIAQSNETASARAKQLQSPGSASSDSVKVHKVQTANQKTGSSSRSNACFCCGKSNHKRDQCRFRGYTCRSCGVVGHLQRVCDQRPQSATRSKVTKRVKTVTVETDEDIDWEIDTICQVGGPCSKPVEL